MTDAPYKNLGTTVRQGWHCELHKTEDNWRCYCPYEREVVTVKTLLDLNPEEEEE